MFFRLRVKLQTRMTGDSTSLPQKPGEIVYQQDSPKCGPSSHRRLTAMTRGPHVTKYFRLKGSGPSTGYSGQLFTLVKSDKCSEILRERKTERERGPGYLCRWGRKPDRYYK